MANKNENLEVKDENNVTPEAGNKPEEQKGEEPEVKKKNGVVMKALKKVGNAFVTFPKKHPVITTGVVSIGTALVGVLAADKAKEYRRDHYPTLPISNNDVIDTTFKPVPEDLPAPETTVDDLHEAFVDTVNQVMENPEIRTF